MGAINLSQAILETTGDRKVFLREVYCGLLGKATKRSWGCVEPADWDESWGRKPRTLFESLELGERLETPADDVLKCHIQAAASNAEAVLLQPMAQTLSPFGTEVTQVASLPVLDLPTTLITSREPFVACATKLLLTSSNAAVRNYKDAVSAQKLLEFPPVCKNGVTGDPLRFDRYIERWMSKREDRERLRRVKEEIGPQLDPNCRFKPLLNRGLPSALQGKGRGPCDPLRLLGKMVDLMGRPGPEDLRGLITEMGLNENDLQECSFMPNASRYEGLCYKQRSPDIQAALAEAKKLPTALERSLRLIDILLSSTAPADLEAPSPPAPSARKPLYSWQRENREPKYRRKRHCAPGKKPAEKSKDPRVLWQRSLRGDATESGVYMTMGPEDPVAHRHAVDHCAFDPAPCVRVLAGSRPVLRTNPMVRKIKREIAEETDPSKAERLRALLVRMEDAARPVVALLPEDTLVSLEKRIKQLPDYPKPVEDQKETRPVPEFSILLDDDPANKESVKSIEEHTGGASESESASQHPTTTGRQTQTDAPVEPPDLPELTDALLSTIPATKTQSDIPVPAPPLTIPAGNPPVASIRASTAPKAVIPPPSEAVSRAPVAPAVVLQSGFRFRPVFQTTEELERQHFDP
ncbi:MAG: hypothetical protein KVP17_001928 [Porospora cf. gigantea B]|nr:MAG: hypothetical protein KVP17_001928 [Porospora cf. gigantea B]